MTLQRIKLHQVVRVGVGTLSEDMASHSGESPFAKAMLKMRAGSAPRLSSCSQRSESATCIRYNGNARLNIVQSPSDLNLRFPHCERKTPAELS